MAPNQPDSTSPPRTPQPFRMRDVPAEAADVLPPILVGRHTPDVERKVRGFYLSVAEIFEAWVQRRESPHTQRAYRGDVMAFVDFLGLQWPKESWMLFSATVSDVQTFRDAMVEDGKAPKTINRRVSSLSSFFKYLQGVAAEFRLPIVVPNPAHAQFISRQSSDPRHETKALSATRARQLMGLPSGDTVIEARDRAILKFYLYTGARISTGCRLKVSDFHQDGEETTIRLNEKGNHRRTIGLHFAAAEAIREYLAASGIDRGPIFRARKSSRGQDLADRPMNVATMYLLLQRYLEKLPGAMKEGRCIYSPHSLRATTATLLLDAGVDITKVQGLLGHRHVTTTQIYDKRRRRTSESASHDVPI